MPRDGERCDELLGPDGPKLCWSPRGEPLAPSELPPIAVPNLPGARIVLRAGTSSSEVGEVALAFCAVAPSRGWTPGLEEMIFARIAALTAEALHFEGSVRAVPAFGFDARPGFVRKLERDPSPTDKRSVEGRSYLRFFDEGRQALVCTVAMAAPPSKSLSALAAATHLEGNWSAPPPPDLLATAILYTGSHPLVVFSSLAGGVLLLLAIVIARRPRPSKTRQAVARRHD